MLLYWGILTVGFLIGAISTFIIFAPKHPEDDPEYETPFASEGNSAGVYTLLEPKNLSLEEKMLSTSQN